MMRRTQVYLDERLSRRLKKQAVAEGRSVAAVVRDALRAYLQKRIALQADPIQEMIGAFNGGSRVGALRHDRMLYGRKD